MKVNKRRWRRGAWPCAGTAQQSSGKARQRLALAQRWQCKAKHWRRTAWLGKGVATQGDGSAVLSQAMRWHS